MATRSTRSNRAAARRRDSTVYPVEERVGEELLQRLVVELLRPLVERWLAAKKVTALTGADQFIYFRQGDVRRRIAPDVFVLPGVRPGRRIRSWKTWDEGIVPSLAVEVVSQEIDKDYIDGPVLYRELGVQELVVFDPDFEDEPHRYRFQVYRQVPRRGLVRTAVTNEDRVYSKVLGCYLRAVGSGESTRLRLGAGRDGETLVPTEAEHERAEKERERAARIVAEDELARLRAQLRGTTRRKRATRR